GDAGVVADVPDTEGSWFVAAFADVAFFVGGFLRFHLGADVSQSLVDAVVDYVVDVKSGGHVWLLCGWCGNVFPRGRWLSLVGCPPLCAIPLFYHGCNNYCNHSFGYFASILKVLPRTLSGAWGLTGGYLFPASA